MRRRDFISLISCTAAAWPILAKAEQPERVRHIGAIFGAGDEIELDTRTRIGAFQQGLKELGWIDGRNIRIELRSGSGDAERIRKFVQELVTLAPDVVVVSGAAAAAPMLKATQT